MLRSAISSFTRVFDALWRCAFDPGSTASLSSMGPGSAVQREGRCTASRIRVICTTPLRPLPAD